MEATHTLRRKPRLNDILLMTMTFCLFLIIPLWGLPLDQVRSIYVPADRISQRIVTEIIHYAEEIPINAAVLHVKDPYGRLAWNAGHPIAQSIKQRNYRGSLPAIVDKLKANNIWTIAKIDVFADHLLVETYPDLGIGDASTNGSWADQNGLHWSNPYDPVVWDYIISLAKEVAQMGFDEIQFDYIRFPSDGKLSAIVYPRKLSGITRAQTIGRFLEKACSALHESDAVISVDLFGLVAWKTDDFGVGQVIEEIAPHVDVISPMLYPSHFPTGFLGKKEPGKYPHEIMEKSTRRLLARTDRQIRPWIQGFWYTPEQITAQLNGIEAAGVNSWSVWSPSGNYRPTYAALASRSDKSLTEPEFYASMDKLRHHFERITKGNERIVNLTNFHHGYTILALERYRKGQTGEYHYPASIVRTLDEGLMDHIMNRRSMPFGKMTPKHVKTANLSTLMLKDLGMDARRMRPGPIYLDWENDCRFSRTVPNQRLDYYKWAAKMAFSPPEHMYMSSRKLFDGQRRIMVD
ncbi:MAG: hypothetical protein HKM93_15080 [Desulfobacteraceae bacterium]|nr:hypothetical protein [Desulfobacteraceae bacterium]